MTRFWRLLEPAERRALLWFLPLLLLAAGVEVVGVAAVIPFLTVLAEPDSLRRLPIVGPMVVASGIEDVGVLVRWAGFLLATIILFANVVMIGKTYWLLRYSWSLNHALSSRLLRHYLAQPYVFTLTRNTAALTNKLIVEVRHVVDAGFRNGMEIAVRGAVIVALVGFLVALDPLLAGVVFGVLGLAYGSIFFASKRYLRRIGRESVAAGAARVKAVNESLGGFKDLKVAGREVSAFEKYVVPSRRFGEVQASIGAISTLPRYALEAVAVGGMVLIATLMAGREGSFTSTLPLLGAYAVAGMRLLPAMQAFFSAFARIRAVTGSFEAVEADFREAAAAEGELEATPAPMQFERSIILRDVRFTYPAAERPALAGVDIEVTRGRSLALVGRTGSGKTTLVDLLLGLLEPNAGTLEVDGSVVTPERLRAYRRLFGYVPQHIFLLDDTVTRNVAFGLRDDEIDLEAVKRACRQAQIADFVETELARGYETAVGERGVRLSGGQRQRIGIARALYHQPPVLVFDEATSALDVHTERLVYQALESIARTHTVITVAHRLATVGNADQVVVLEGGRVVDRGAPREVLERYQGGEAVAQAADAAGAVR